MAGFFEEKRNVATIVLLMLLAFLLSRFEGVVDVIRRLLAIMNPLILGMVIALLVNLPMRYLERVLPFHHLRRFKRPICLTLAMAFALALLSLMLLVIIPEVRVAIENIIVVLPSAIRRIIGWIDGMGLALRSNLNLSTNMQSDVQQKVESVYKYLMGGLTSTTGIISSAATAVLDTIIGFVFAIYLLYAKERLLSGFSRLSRAYLKPAASARIHHALRVSVNIFSDFFGGQCIQAFSSALLTWLCLTIFSIPYAVLIAMLVFLTAFLPVFGPYISGAVGALLVFSQNAGLVGWFLIVFLVVQQVAGSVIYPRIMAGAIELPSIWVLVSVTLGGGLMGIAGMLFFIPLTAIIYKLVKEDAARRLTDGPARAENTHAGH